MNAFSIGTSAIAVGQRALDLIGQNMSNAATPGYHRQALDLVSRTTGGLIGNGVEVASLTRYDVPSLRSAILRGNSEQACTTVRLDTRRPVETLLGSGSGGVGDGFENLFNQIVQLTSRPDAAAARRPIITAASDLAQRFNATAGEIDRFRSEFAAQISQTVSEVNDFATRIADLNVKIAHQVQAGGQPNDLIDQRDKLIDDLSRRVDVRVIDQPFGMVNVLSSHAAIVVGEFTNQFQSTPTSPDGIAITQLGDVSGKAVRFEGGKLGGQLQEYNQDLPATRARLDGLANELIRQMNQVQATGLGTSGPFDSLTGTVGVADPMANLADLDLPFPISEGDLTVNVTDTNTGNRTNTTVHINPATDSLDDVALALSGIPGLAATIEPGNVLKITAQSGFKFDFAGRDTNSPSTGAVPNSDTGNFLSGLGINGLFNGTDAASITLNPAIAADPGRLAASRTGLPGDSTNLERFVAIRDQKAFSGRTLSGEFSDLAASVGSEVSSLSDQQTARAGVLQNLNVQEQSVTGVDINEELVNLLNFQRMVEGASKYMATVNDALDSILNIIR